VSITEDDTPTNYVLLTVNDSTGAIATYTFAANTDYEYFVRCEELGVPY